MSLKPYVHEKVFKTKFIHIRGGDGGGVMKERLSEETIAMRVVKELNDGDYVNLGFGIPLKCSLFIPPEKEIYFHAEQGVMGYTRTLTVEEWSEADLDYVDAGGRFIPPSSPGMSVFDIATSFDMILGGHLDCSVMGALEVSEKGDLANWTSGSAETGGIGGSMDLAAGARKVIIAMTHTTRSNSPKIVNQCRLPLTATQCVDLIVTDLAVIDVIPKGLLIKEVAPGWSVDEIQALTEPRLILSPELKEIEL
jgi:3-oxoacid CoA-transferase subunit B